MSNLNRSQWIPRYCPEEKDRIWTRVTFCTKNKGATKLRYIPFNWSTVSHFCDNSTPALWKKPQSISNWSCLVYLYTHHHPAAPTNVTYEQKKRVISTLWISEAFPIERFACERDEIPIPCIRLSKPCFQLPSRQKKRERLPRKVALQIF